MPSAETTGTPVEDLLTAADDLLTTAAPDVRGRWPRMAAFLIRMALEQAIDELWARTQPGLADCSMRAQLLCLREYADPSAAQRASAAWTGLSQACHYQTYELAPTAAELRGWYEDVAAVHATLTRTETR